MAVLDVKAPSECKYDILSLGEVMIRLDPGDERIHTTRTFRVWEGGGEYNVARGLKRTLRQAGRRGDGHRGQSRRPAARRPDVPGRRQPGIRQVGAFRRHRPQDPRRPELHRTRLRHPRGRRLLRPGQQRRLATEERRHRLGPHLRPGRRPLVPHRRHLRRPVDDHARRHHRGGHDRQEIRHDRLLRPELPQLALARRRRPGEGPPGQPGHRPVHRRDARQRRGFHGGAGLRGRGPR